MEFRANDFPELYGRLREETGRNNHRFYFRDKSKGQGHDYRSVYKDMAGENKEKVLIGGLTAYVHFFSKSYISQELLFLPLCFREACWI